MFVLKQIGSHKQQIDIFFLKKPTTSGTNPLPAGVVCIVIIKQPTSMIFMQYHTRFYPAQERPSQEARPEALWLFAQEPAPRERFHHLYPQGL